MTFMVSENTYAKMERDLKDIEKNNNKKTIKKIGKAVKSAILFVPTLIIYGLIFINFTKRN